MERRSDPTATNTPQAYASATGRGIGNLLDSLPGTGPRTLLGALALVVGITFWLQPERPTATLTGVDEAIAAEPVVEPDPVVSSDGAKDESEATRVSPKHETEIEAEGPTVLP